MFLPALKSSVPTSLGGQSVEDFIRNSTKDLQQVAAAMPGNGVAGAVYLGFNGNTGAWTLNKEVIDPKSFGHILVPQPGMFEGCTEWANGSPLQKIRRPLLGVDYGEPMSERLLQKPLSPTAYRKDTDGPSLVLGFIGVMLDDGSTVVFEHNSGGGKKAVSALATTATQALAAFGEMVHPVIELGGSSYEIANRMIHEPKLVVTGYVTDKRAQEADVISDEDIVTRPTTSKAKLRRDTGESPAV